MEPIPTTASTRPFTATTSRPEYRRNVVIKTTIVDRFENDSDEDGRLQLSDITFQLDLTNDDCRRIDDFLQTNGNVVQRILPSFIELLEIFNLTRSRWPFGPLSTTIMMFAGLSAFQLFMKIRSLYRFTLRNLKTPSGTALIVGASVVYVIFSRT